MKAPSLGPVTWSDALDWARSRGVVLPGEYYAGMPAAMRSRSFTVSGLSALDQVRRVLDSLGKAQEGGQSFKQWRDEVDFDQFALPKGRGEIVFRNALQTSYAQGRHEQHQRNKRRRPFLMYDAINDGRVRTSHVKMDNHIASVDDPIWQEWTPPNGHQCRCTTIALTEAQARARGFEPTTPAPDVDPDDGWDYNPGETQDDKLLQIRASRIGKLPPDMQPSALNALIKQPDPPAPVWEFTDAPTLAQVKQQGRERFDEIVATVQHQGRPIGELLADSTVGIDQIEQAADAIRAAVLSRLDEVQGIGRKRPNLVQKSGKGVAAMRSAAGRYPDAWVEQANDVPLVIQYSTKRGSYHPAWKWDAKEGRYLPRIIADEGDTAVHEYGHHLQRMLPALDQVFQDLHRERTLGDPLVSIALGEVARPDNYFAVYQGREYGQGQALEVLTMTFQAILGDTSKGKRRHYSARYLARLLKLDPEMFQVGLGLLFHYRP